jgi:hypothetical protein
MIAFKDDLPLVRFSPEEVGAFRRDWLLRSLAFAARRAGYDQWWLAEHVAESVTSYLRSNYDGPVVTLPRLEKAVRSALQAIGYGEVATSFALEPPFALIDLSEIAEKAGHGYELMFFELLSRDLQDALRNGRTYIEISGVAECVKALRARKNWSARCSTLRAEIVTFARQRIEEEHPDRDIALTVT